MKSLNEVKQFVVELLKLYVDHKTDYAHVGKAYYYANRFSMEECSSMISTFFNKLPDGPDMENYSVLFKDMEEEGVICVEKNRPYISLKNNKKAYAKFPQVKLDMIKKAYLKVKDKDSGQVKEAIHKEKSAQNTTITDDEENENVRKFFDGLPKHK